MENYKEESMKKIIALLLAFVLLFSLAACGSKPTIPQPGENSGSNSGGNAQQPEEEFSVGKTEGSTYTNEFFKFALNLNDDWYIASDKELAEIQGLAIEGMNNEAAKKVFENGQAAYLFFAQNLATNENIQVIVEGVPLENLKVNQIIKNTAAALEESYKQQGIKVAKSEVTNITFDGRTETGLEVEASGNGVTVYQTYVAMIKGKYYCSIVLTALSQESLKEQISFIKNIK